jgi:UDP-N-acetylglucosamine transferase subunit ALG13
LTQPRAVVLVTGSELVRGALEDGNGPFLARELIALGFDVARIVIVGDRPHELEQAMREADVVVTHAGTGSALAALEAGQAPVLVPRSAARGEHVDDHQYQTARELAGRSLAVQAEARELTLEHLARASSLRVSRLAAPPAVHLAGAPSPHRAGCHAA